MSCSPPTIIFHNIRTCLASSWLLHNHLVTDFPHHRLEHGSVDTRIEPQAVNILEIVNGANIRAHSATDPQVLYTPRPLRLAPGLLFVNIDLNIRKKNEQTRVFFSP